VNAAEPLYEIETHQRSGTWTVPCRAADFELSQAPGALFWQRRLIF
jgi:hypothetical protein